MFCVFEVDIFLQIWFSMIVSSNINIKYSSDSKWLWKHNEFESKTSFDESNVNVTLQNFDIVDCLSSLYLLQN